MLMYFVFQNNYYRLKVQMIIPVLYESEFCFYENFLLDFFIKNLIVINLMSLNRCTYTYSIIDTV